MTRWPSQWQLSATCLPLLCSALCLVMEYLRPPNFTDVHAWTAHLKFIQSETTRDMVDQGCNGVEENQHLHRNDLGIDIRKTFKDFRGFVNISMQALEVIKNIISFNEVGNFKHYCLCEAIK